MSITKVSYSSASTFKACPEKYHLSRKYTSKYRSSAFLFGKAIEQAVSYSLLNKSSEDVLEKSLDTFYSNWKSEYNGSEEPKPIWDSLLVKFYQSDFDSNLLDSEDENSINEYLKEFIPANSNSPWMEVFDSITVNLKDEKITDNERIFYNRVMWTCLHNKGIAMITSFIKKMLPKINLVPGQLQKPITIKNEEGDEIIGYIDAVITHEDFKDQNIIIDIKTAAYPYSAHALETSEQLKTYLAAIGAELNTKRAGYLVFLKKLIVKKKCNNCGHLRVNGLSKKCKECNEGSYTVPELESEIQFITKEYAFEDVEVVLNDYANITTAIKNNITYKNPSNCFNFNNKCEFYNVCWERKNPDELSELTKKVHKVSSEKDEGKEKN